MNMMKSVFRAVLMLLLFIAPAALCAQAGAPWAPSSGAAVKQLGSIRKVTGADLSLATDQGSEIDVKVQPNARIVCLEPGQTDLKSAAPLLLNDLQVGDRVLVRGTHGSDSTSLLAFTIVVMKQEDIAQMEKQEMLDWQRRGVGGLVKEVNSQAGSIMLSIANKPVAVLTTPKTIIKRYAPDSIKWEDTVPARLDDIRPGDQLRAKGNRNEDGTQLAAEEIVSGTFRNVSGLITSIDSAHSNLTVQDLDTKKSVTVQITADSQMKELPRPLAQGIAMRIKGVAPPPAAAPAGASGDAVSSRGGDLNQMLARLPAAQLGDLQKGEAVMIVSTQGSSGKPPVAITLLGGADPILTAAPSGSEAVSFLTPWTLASAPAGDQQ
jgi:hypothetical protein